MKLFNIQAVLIIMAAFFNSMQAQDLKGIILSENKSPIKNVSISISNLLITTTDANGAFSLPNNYTFPIELYLKHQDYDTIKVLFTKNNQVFYIKEFVPTENINTIIVNAQNEKSSSVITPTSSIGSEDINQQSPIDVVSAINQTAGIYIQSGAINTNRIVIRGVGARTLYGTNKIRAYFNDIPITNGIGETAIDVYDPEDLQSIEIIKGPKATQYGTNLGGTLLLTSKKPEVDGLSIRNNTTIGSFGLFKNAIITDYSKDKLALHVSYDHLELDAFRENSNYNRNSIFLNSSYRFNVKTELLLLMNYSNYKAQIPSSIGKSAFEEDPSQAAFTWRQAKGFEADAQTLTGVSLKHQFTDDFTSATSIFYTYSDHYEPRPFNILDEFTNGFGARTVFNKSFDFINRKAEWTFGGELFKDEYHWKTIENLYQNNNGNGSLEGMLLSNNEEYRQQLNLFSSIKLPVLEGVTLQFGVNYNKTNYDFQDEFNLAENSKSASRNFKAIVAPNFNALYQFTPNQNVYANVSYGFNYPSLEEALTPEGIINPDINPEKGFNYELGSDAYFFEKKWHILASVYLLDIKNLLVAQRVGDDQYIGRNAGRTIHKGLELSTDYKWVLNEAFTIKPYVNAAFNWHRFEDFVSEDIDYSGNKLTGVPNTTIASGVAFRYQNFSFYSNALYVGAMPLNDANTGFSDAYNIFNFKLVYESTILKQLDLKFNFGVNNVLDRPYASAILINATGFNNSEPRYYYPGNPRNYYGGVSLRYHL